MAERLNENGSGGTPATQQSTEATGDQEKRPLIFISHKHADAPIAKVLSNWIDDITGGHARIHLSSDSSFESPEIGADLDKQLGEYLARAGVVILLYTSNDHDWSYCTWECGVALNPLSPDTRIVCFECLDDSPSILGGTKKVIVKDEESVISFAKMFGEANFFPGREQPPTGQNDEKLVQKGKDLCKLLIEALPKEPIESWSAWPFLRIRLDAADIEALATDGDADEKVQRCYELLKESARVMIWSPSTPGLFGKEDLGVECRFGDLIQTWDERKQSGTDDWVFTLAQQIVDGSRRNAPNIREWARFRPVDGNSELVIGVGRVKRGASHTSFDCYFYRLVDVQSVESIMNRVSNMYLKDLDSDNPAEIRIQALIKEMHDLRRTRLPLLEGKIAKYIIHGSMIDKALDREPVEDLTLADLLADEDMCKLFAESWVALDRKATIEDAKEKMQAVPDCQDAFVTESGERSSPVLGWLCDRDLIDAGIRY
jgi:hypothetical protein